MQLFPFDFLALSIPTRIEQKVCLVWKKSFVDQGGTLKVKSPTASSKTNRNEPKRDAANVRVKFKLIGPIFSFG
jgi:hypothetical protein